MARGREEANFQGKLGRFVKKDLQSLYFHDNDSRKNEPGFLDNVILRGDTLIFSELKSARGKPSAEQIEWLDGLQRVKYLEVGLWRPDMWEDIVKYLASVGHGRKDEIVIPGEWPVIL